MEINKIIINKNRGWRGLAEVKCINCLGEDVLKMIFSFSADVWFDLYKGIIVVQDDTNYIVIDFNNTIDLPKGQRSVLIKNFKADATEVNSYPKNDWQHAIKRGTHFRAVSNFIRNRNNHTQSDWNCIGIRVVPMI